MPRRFLLACFVFVLLAAAASAQEPPRPTAELPVRRIVLFSSGVGFFQRDGEVDGTTQVHLRFRTEDINDLLKSMIVQDRGGGQVGVVQYDHREPVAKALKSFAIDLTQNPSLADLLRQVRGERIELVNAAVLGKDGQPQKLTGLLVGVQTLMMPVGTNQTREVDRLSLLTDEGLLRLDLEQVQRIRFLKPQVEEEFRKALLVLASSHDQQKKSVTLNFLGNGKRAVRVGYVMNSPMWKTSYRLALEDGGKAFLQGWAIVENTNDDDWKNVRLSLVAGRPISFLMDLYEPLYVPRPVVEPELFASLRPRVHSGDIAPKEQAMRHVGGLGGQRLAGGGAVLVAPEEAAGDARGKRKPMGFVNDFEPRKKLVDAEEQFDLRRGVASAALAKDLGEFFHYEISQPVTLPRQKSALLPIVNSPVEVTKVAIFNDEVHEKYPMHGLRVKNTSGLHLMQGPITVFDAGSYAGEAQIGNVQPNETRLISYAVDLGTEVAKESKEGEEKLVTVQISKGILRMIARVRHTHRYTIKNRTPQARTLLIEHPYQENWTLITPEKFAERTRDLYRFEVKVEPNKPTILEVVEDEPGTSEARLLDGAEDGIRHILQASVTSAPVRAALTELLKRRKQLADLEREQKAEEAALAVIGKDQERMRNNMERVPKESDAFKRYLKKFDEQETEIEKRRERVALLQQQSEQQRKALEEYVQRLEVQ